MNLEYLSQIVGEAKQVWFKVKLFKVFVQNIGIGLGVEAYTSRLFFIGSYMNNRQSGEV